MTADLIGVLLVFTLFVLVPIGIWDYKTGKLGIVAGGFSNLLQRLQIPIVLLVILIVTNYVLGSLDLIDTEWAHLYKEARPALAIPFVALIGGIVLIAISNEHAKWVQNIGIAMTILAIVLGLVIINNTKNRISKDGLPETGTTKAEMFIGVAGGGISSPVYEITSLKPDTIVKLHPFNKPAFRVCEEIGGVSVTPVSSNSAPGNPDCFIQKSGGWRFYHDGGIGDSVMIRYAYSRLSSSGVDGLQTIGKTRYSEWKPVHADQLRMKGMSDQISLIGKIEFIPANLNNPTSTSFPKLQREAKQRRISLTHLEVWNPMPHEIKTILGHVQADE